jgi:DNA mismatch repair protein MutH
MNSGAGKAGESVLIAARNSFKPFMGKTGQEICRGINKKINPQAKHYYRLIANAVLAKSSDSRLEPLKRDEVILRAIRVRDGQPVEDVSFASFEYITMRQESWKSALIKNIFSRPFIFVIFEIQDDKTVLSELRYWKMPEPDLAEVKRVWQEAVDRIDEDRYDALPKKRQSSVCHIRTHGRNKKDERMTPRAQMQKKRSFYLNNYYLASRLFGRELKEVKSTTSKGEVK